MSPPIQDTARCDTPNEGGVVYLQAGLEQHLGSSAQVEHRVLEVPGLGPAGTGEEFHGVSGRLVHIQGSDAHNGFGIELTPWSAAESFLANLTR
ncbi:hypothetical protein ACFY2N_26760 [Streptomyces rubiginosohelvolus]|uniref:hypothetical protein n=1 Tax=Streptomyces rubiginosohelvolus TaxID=67362 RepID=UPI00367B43AB